ncbi:MAG: hypothetical protein IJZ85_00155 [Lachnospiraceae bacterium]|nr:hypothetical protein [Lachnospiraceae bacterium]
MKKKIETYADWIFGGLLCISVFMYLSRINMGMADLDESFYLTIPFRMTQGDALIVDEWHVSQLAGCLLYPLMKVYLAVVGGTEGIVLNFRYIYLFFQIAVTVTGYLLLRRKNSWLAVAVSLIYMLFTPFGIKALSYNTMGLMAVYLFAVLNVVKTEKPKLQYAFMGLLLAAAVLCNPYMVLLYVGWSVLTVLCQLGKMVCRDRKRGSEGCHRAAAVFSWEKLLFLTGGAGILLVYFLCVQLSRTGLKEMLYNLPFVMSDSAHKAKTLRSITHAFTYYVDVYPLYFWIWAVCVLPGLLIKRFSAVFFSVLSVASVWLTLYFAFELTDGIGYAAIMLPLTMAGLAAFLFTREKRWELFGGWLIGVFYGFCMGASSNNGIYTFVNACTVSSAVSVLIIADYASEAPVRRLAAAKTEAGVWLKRVLSRLSVASLILLIAVQLFAEGYILLNHVFWESGPESMTERIEAGPLKGLTTTPYKKNRYMVNYENALSLREQEGENVLFYCRFISGYLLFDDWNNGGSSAWLADSVVDLNDPRMLEYAARHPEKKPDVIYVDTESTTVWTDEQWEAYCVENGYRLEAFQKGGYALIDAAAK